jgi:hypothetical protein
MGEAYPGLSCDLSSDLGLSNEKIELSRKKRKRKRDVDVLASM